MYTVHCMPGPLHQVHASPHSIPQSPYEVNLHFRDGLTPVVSPIASWLTFTKLIEACC